MLRSLALLCAFAAPALATDSAAPDSGAGSSPPSTLAQALRQGEFRLDLRYRFENVDDDAFDKEARASTLRTAAGWESAPFQGLSFHLEVENVTVVGSELYDNAGAGSRDNGITDRPVVADPALTEVNQAFVRYSRGGSRVQAGRQEILRGDQRFVGNVGWRQNHQSFDALELRYRSGESSIGWTLEYALVTAVQRIFGDSQEMTSHLLDVSLDLEAAGTLTAYGYLLDYDDAVGLSSLTVGAELEGSRDLARGPKLQWELEYARQRDAGDNPSRIDTDYVHARLGGGLGGVTVQVGWELLGGRPGRGAFRTPLATLHKFNGWADRFLVTPVNGLEDLYLSVGGTVAGVGWTLVAHEFSADTGGLDYGSELDVQLLYKTAWKQTFGFKAALYDADGFSRDAEKVMIWTTFGI